MTKNTSPVKTQNKHGAKAWRKLLFHWVECNRCPLHKTAKHHVLGEGVLPCKLLFLGEGPGKTEDVMGRPFVGQAGNLLRKALVDASIPADAWFISNAVACRPCDGLGQPNRQPTDGEITACTPRVNSLIELARPRTLVLLGRVAQTCFNNHYAANVSSDTNLLFLYHPAYILRNGGFSSPEYPKFVRQLRNAYKEVKNEA